MISESVVTVLAAGERNGERPMLEIDARHVALHDLAAEALGLRAHLGHQVGAHDAVAEPRPVLDHRGQHQLSTGLEPSTSSGARFARAV